MYVINNPFKAYKINLQITVEIKKNTFQAQHVLLSLKQIIILTEKQLFIGFHSMVTGCSFSLSGKFPSIL